MNNKTKYNFRTILSQFEIRGNIAEIKPHGSGHIHDTYHLVNAMPEHPDYLLQRINSNIFENVPALMENIQLVTHHLRKKYKATDSATADKEVLTVVPALDSKGYYHDPAGNFWRIYVFLKDTRSYDVVQTVRQAHEGGKAYGKFLALLSDLDANLLHETISDFHDLDYRHELLESAISEDPADRVRNVHGEISFVKNRMGSMSFFIDAAARNLLPYRVTHNDTKFNNVLLDRQDNARCVIDLDTVMRGFIAYDFGDAVRTIINSTHEDESDLEKVSLNMALFAAFTKGFLHETVAFLSDFEIRSLARGVLFMPFIIGLRFLTDYIDGDKYYKINFPEHNLQRARVQFRLVEKLEDRYENIKEIIAEVATSKKQVLSQ